MEIRFTKEQYEDLVKLVYLGTWMVNAFRTDDRVKKFDELEQYILSYFKEFGLKQSIIYDNDLKEYFVAKELEEGELDQYIDDYNNDNFWDELIYRLARRDLIREYGEDKVTKMTWQERLEKEAPFIEKYEEEFEEHGIERIEAQG
ncbi:MAG: hypothetical protein IT393_05550 [Nitrospirae bacterium]|nr:hypothetical protein [Nitrospirota bacterium]